MNVGVFIGSLVGLGVIMIIGIIIGASALHEFFTATLPGRWPRMVFGVVFSLILVCVSLGVMFTVFESRYNEAVASRLVP